MHRKVHLSAECRCPSVSSVVQASLCALWNIQHSRRNLFILLRVKYETSCKISMGYLRSFLTFVGSGLNHEFSLKYTSFFHLLWNSSFELYFFCMNYWTVEFTPVLFCWKGILDVSWLLLHIKGRVLLLFYVIDFFIMFVSLIWTLIGWFYFVHAVIFLVYFVASAFSKSADSYNNVQGILPTQKIVNKWK